MIFAYGVLIHARMLNIPAKVQTKFYIWVAVYPYLPKHYHKKAGYSVDRINTETWNIGGNTILIGYSFLFFP